MNYFDKIFCILIIISCVSQNNLLFADNSNCIGRIAESIPEGLVFNSSFVSNSTFDQLIELISNAKQSIDIASFYWTLLGSDVMPEPEESSIDGTLLLQAIIDAGKTRSVKVRIAVNDDMDTENSTDLKLLSSIADIRKVNFTRIVGAGILHTKFLTVDNQHLYIGSANMDWRSLTQVKELGIVINDCDILANDLLKIFEIYWYLGIDNSTIPEKWPKQYSTNYNESKQLELPINQLNYSVYISSSPKQLCSDGRTNDIDAILSVINSAKKFIYIAVMDYFPAFIYTKEKQFWPIIDDALKKAAIERNVNIKLLTSRWNHTRYVSSVYLRSLAAFNSSKLIGGSIEVKQFIVPSFTPKQSEIPFSRVNHNKYMVTESIGYIGTSNWSADYFVNTGGVAFIFTPNNSSLINLRNDIELIFKRDWSSSYAHNI
jgi:phospholipase D3/4